ncbi:MAG TPA: hypothetical protein VEL03_01635 [Streptosporangiaceae bacterium]|nr:hypothetical protein [Streptosporangiaceae bacterium]
MTKSPIAWLDDVVKHDYDAAYNYLSLKLDERRASEVVDGLKKAKVTQRRANDILRATGLPPLPLTDPGVKRDLLKLLSGEKLSPVLICDQKVGADIADGYHRVSLAYNIDPFMSVPLRLG